MKIKKLVLVPACSLILFNFTSTGQSKEDPALLTIMYQLMGKMSLINQGIWSENFEQIEKAAYDIANHPQAPKEEKQKLAALLGDDIKKFKKYDKIVHDNSELMSEAAKNKNMEKILEYYSIVQKNCVNCHQLAREKYRASKN